MKFLDAFPSLFSRLGCSESVGKLIIFPAFCPLSVQRLLRDVLLYMKWLSAQLMPGVKECSYTPIVFFPMVLFDMRA